MSTKLQYAKRECGGGKMSVIKTVTMYIVCTMYVSCL